MTVPNNNYNNPSIYSILSYKMAAIFLNLLICRFIQYVIYLPLTYLSPQKFPFFGIMRQQNKPHCGKHLIHAYIVYTVYNV